ncbi:MAG: hypothetical protein JSU70_04215 [Phycisphaerales bacterium]|nr:MAG: hypothetical protein JSU70_04215 [Phycisphaerales bacterium]
MDSQKGTFLSRYKWHVVAVLIALGSVVLLAVFTDIFQEAETGPLRNLVWMLGALIFLVALLTMLSRVFKIADTLRENSTQLEEVTRALENIHSGLAQINHSTRISETAKAIAFRDADTQSLRETVFEKLEQQDFDAAQKIVDEIAGRPQYKEFAEQLRRQVDKYHSATDQGRINQVVAHVEELFEACEWVRASIQIEGLIKAYPDAEAAKRLRHKLLERKDERKKILLTAWDDAIKQEETDRSLEILKELDLYLTPNEALALQEAARDVFRTKLHNLGVRFSIAVSDKKWADALDVGRQIVNDFPNSKMSEEIRQKLDVLRQNVQMQNS